MVKAISALLRPSCQAAVLIPRKNLTLAWESSGRMSLGAAHRIWHWQRKIVLSWVCVGSLSLHYHEPICLLLFIHGLAFPMGIPWCVSGPFRGAYWSLPPRKTFTDTHEDIWSFLKYFKAFNLPGEMVRCVCAGKLEDSNSNPNTHVNAKYTCIL